jgi:hypothetical protein
MSLKVAVALVGDPLSEPQLPYDQREQVEFEVSEDETLGAVIDRAADHWDIGSTYGSRASPSVAFYEEGHRPRLWMELALLDGDGRIYFTSDWRPVTYRDLLAAQEAGLLTGEPTRTYLLVLFPGVGDGGLLDWQTLSAAWDGLWYLLDKIDVVGGAYAAKKLIYDRLRARVKSAPIVVQQHRTDWEARGVRPDNLDRLLGQRPWAVEDFAERFDCTPQEAEALLLGAGYSRAESGLYRRGEDDEARLLHGHLELMLQAGFVSDPQILSDTLFKRSKQFISTGKVPEVELERDLDTMVAKELPAPLGLLWLLRSRFLRLRRRFSRQDY